MALGDGNSSRAKARKKIGVTCNFSADNISHDSKSHNLHKLSQTAKMVIPIPHMVKNGNAFVKNPANFFNRFHFPENTIFYGFRYHSLP